MTPKHPCHRKTRYASYDEAALALVDAKIRRALRLRHHQKRREQRVYYCGNCNGHHLTSAPENDRRHTR